MRRHEWDDAGTGTWVVERQPCPFVEGCENRTHLVITGPRVDVGTMRDVLADEVLRLSHELEDCIRFLRAQDLWHDGGLAPAEGSPHTRPLDWESWAPRCKRTGNPIGTDTRPVGPDGKIVPCSCASCSPDAPDLLDMTDTEWAFETGYEGDR